MQWHGWFPKENSTAFTSDPEGNINEGVNSTPFIPLVLIITTTHINGCNHEQFHVHIGITVVKPPPRSRVPAR